MMMPFRYRLLIAVALILPVSAEDLTYRDGTVACHGYLARPAAAATVPSVLVLPAWMGLDDHSRRSADRLAAMGYLALAADIYGEGKRAADMQEAGALAGSFRSGDRARYRSRIVAALQALAAQPGCDPARVAVIGYCFGGTGALEAARAGLPVRAVVSFHGALGAGTGPTVRPIRASVLALHGADDPLVPPAEVAAFMDEMRGASADWQVVHYSGAKHAFTDPSAGNDASKPFGYEPRSAARAWEAMRAFLAESLGR